MGRPDWMPASAGMTESSAQTVIPAQAGIQALRMGRPDWMPAFASMTEERPPACAGQASRA